MIAGFSRKKIASPSSFGERLKQARQEKGVSLIEAENATKVRAKFLTALENSNWAALPQAVYARGFLLAYLRFLELTQADILPLFEREAAAFGHEGREEIAYDRQLKDKKVIITPKLLGYSAASIFVMAMFAYIIYQVAGFAGSPDLKIIRPSNNVVMESDSIDLEGLTDTDTIVKVNNENVPVTSEGKFFLGLKLHRGVNVISVRAINKARKESVETYTIEYRPKTATAAESGDKNF